MAKPTLTILGLDPGTSHAAHNRADEKETRARLHARFGGKIVFVGQFKGVHARGEFTCRDCGSTVTSNFYEKLKAVVGCRACATSQAQLKSHSDFLKDWSSRGSPGLINILGKYTGSQKGIRVSCVRCNHEWHPKPNNLISGRTGCPQCTKAGLSGGRSVRWVRLDGVDYAVEGYEPVAVSWLTAKGFLQKDIWPFSSGKVPCIRYKYRGRFREYRPDFLVGSNTLLEVKSTWTLLEWLDMNKAKARACLEQGYQFKMLLCSPQEGVMLPEAWLKMNAAKIGAYFRSRTLKTRIILALDPGVTNYGWAVVQAGQRTMPRVLASGMLTNTLRNITNGVTPQISLHMAEVKKILKDYSCNAIVVERFMSRGHGGTTIELVNMMIGAITHLIHRTHKQILIIPSSQWKNALNRVSPLESVYPVLHPCTPHQIDAAFIGLYGAYYFFGRKPYESYAKFREPFLKMIKATAE